MTLTSVLELGEENVERKPAAVAASSIRDCLQTRGIVVSLTMQRKRFAACELLS